MLAYECPMVTCFSAREKARLQKKAMKEKLNLPGAVPMLLSTFLFLMLVGFGLYSFFCMVFAVLRLFIFGETALFVVGTVIDALFYASLFFLVGPLFLGRLRMAGLLFHGRVSLQKEQFYYILSPRRYGRALLVVAIGVLALAPAVGTVMLSVTGAQWVYVWLVFRGVASTLALLAYVGLLLATLLPLLLVLYLSCVFFAFPVLMVGNEELSLKAGLLCSLRLGWRLRSRIFRWYLYVLKNLALSFFTVGILYLLRYGQEHLLSYVSLIVEGEREA